MCHSIEYFAATYDGYQGDVKTCMIYKIKEDTKMNQGLLFIQKKKLNTSCTPGSVIVSTIKV